MFRLFGILGAGNAFLAVALGAFGAHALKSRIPAARLSAYETGVHYHMTHALALILLALLSERIASRNLVVWAGSLIQTGILLFSGSLYALAITGIGVLGAITPLGGICFLTAWILIFAAFLRKPDNGKAPS